MTILDKLTSHQRRVVELVLEGKSDKEIGLILGLSHRTVEAHKQNARERLGIPKDYRSFGRVIRELMAREEEDRRLKA